MENSRDLLAKKSLQCYNEKLFAGTSGNLSVFDEKNQVIHITPSSVPYPGMTGKDIVTIRLDGEVVYGIHPPSSEWRMHGEIYKHRDDIKSIVHTHSPYATSFAVTHQEIPVILVEMLAYLGGAIPLAAFAYNGTPEVGQQALKVMKETYGCLMANHGVLAIGEDLESAYIRAVYIEDAAKIYSLAINNGKENIVLISDEDILKMNESKKQ